MVFDAVNAALILSKGVGIPPNDMQTFSLASEDDGIKITFKGPEISYLHGYEAKTPTLACVPAGVMIRYSDTAYPKTVKEGKLAIDFNYNENSVDPTNPTEQTHKQVGLTMNTKYYFTAFPYSDYGIYNQSQNSKNKAELTWVGNKGTISVNVQTPTGYTGTLGEYTITLLDQAEESPQNIEQTFSGSGLKQIGNLTAGKTYKVRISDTTDLQAPEDSEAITIVGGYNHEVTMAYVYRYGNVTINVTAPSSFGITLGTYNIILTPTQGEAIQQSTSGAGAKTISNVENGTYTLSFSKPTHYNAPSSQQVVVSNGASSPVSCGFTLAPELGSLTWTQIRSIAQSGNAQSYLSLGDQKTTTVNYREVTFNSPMDTTYYTENNSSSKSMPVKIVAFNVPGTKSKNIVFMTTDIALKVSLRTKSQLSWDTERNRYRNYIVGKQDDFFPEINQYKISVTNQTCNGHSYSGDYETATVSDYIYPPSFTQVGGSDSAIGNDGTRYPYFTSNASRQLSPASEWVTRTTSYTHSSYGCFMEVSAGGVLSLPFKNDWDGAFYGLKGMPLCFVIG